MHRNLIFAALFAFFSMPPAMAQAQAAASLPPPAALVALTPQTAIDRLFKADHAQADWFAASFISAVPLAKVDAILESLRDKLGPYERTTVSGDQYLAFFEHGVVTLTASFDSLGRFDGLLIRKVEPEAASLPDALHTLSALEGRTSYLVLENGKEIASSGQGEALGVGSTFKLAILKALRRQIDAKHRRWSDVVRLQSSWKSLPSGTLQTWPTGTPLTLQTLASLMISQSDNTATDSLINILGRSAIEPFASANRPLMTTRNMFTMKTKSAAGLQAVWRSGTTAQRYALVLQMDAMPLPPLEQLDASPKLSDIEWHFTNRQVCALMAKVADLPLMSINPGVAEKTDWKRVAYKGGSDFGVISMTTDLIRKDGRHYCLSVTQNNDQKPVDEARFTTLYSGVVSALKSSKP